MFFIPPISPGYSYYKFITEYRVFHAQGTYVRVIRQSRNLTFDEDGNGRLCMAIIDISPDY